MKIFSLISIMLVCVVSCDINPASSQTYEPEVPVIIENLAGTWDWIRSVDSIGQVVEESSLYNTQIIITQDFSFKQYLNGTLFLNDCFNLYKTVIQNTIDTVSVLDWKTSKYFNYIVYSLKSNTLIIGRSVSNVKNIYTRKN